MILSFTDNYQFKKKREKNVPRSKHKFNLKYDSEETSLENAMVSSVFTEVVLTPVLTQDYNRRK